MGIWMVRKKELGRELVMRILQEMNGIRYPEGVKYYPDVEDTESVQVFVTSSSGLPKQFALARLFSQNNIIGISRVKIIHQFKTVVSFDKDVNAVRFIECKTFHELGWRCQNSLEVGTSFGVIRDIELDISDEDILKNLSCDFELVSAKRLNKRKYSDESADGWEKCEVIRLGFRVPSLPAYVYLHGMRIRVDSYIFPVTQCYRCWKFGHSRLLCPSKKVVCPKCTKNHESCDSTTFRCVNCCGNHMALQKVSCF